MKVHGSRSLVVLAALSLLVALLVPGAAAQPTGCEEVMTVAELQAELAAGAVTGEGLTVVSGTTPRSFDVEVIGILEDGISVGRDMILVDVSADFIDDAGGIWQGMSGSPVYVDGQLVGAVAYGLSFVSTSIGGLTPAEDMLDLIDLPDGDPSAFAAATAPASEVTVTGALAEEVLRRLDQPQARSRGNGTVSFRTLAMPLSVSGLSPARLDTLQSAMDRAGVEVSAYAGSSAAFQQVQSTTQVPAAGGNIAVADSYGDLTFAAVGTTTAVCDGKVVAFGHPFQFAGETVAGASLADAITIVPDPGFAPFKLANIGRVFGTIDQDRGAGVRGRNGDIPDTTPVRSQVTDDSSGSSRRGRTDVVRPIAVPDLSAFHLLANIDTVIDRIGRGSSTVEVRVTGEGSESGRFSMTRSNLFASPFDIAFESIFDSLTLLAQLRDFRGEDVTFNSVDYTASLVDEYLAYGFGEVRVGVDGSPPEPFTGFELVVQPGSTITIEIDLEGLADDASAVATLELTVPGDATGFGFVDISAGSFGGFFPEECFFNPEACEPAGEAETVQELADLLAAQPNNATISANLFLEQIPPGEGPIPVPGETPEPEPGPGEPIPAEPDPDPEPAFAQAPAEPITASVEVDRVVQDFFGFSVVVDGSQCPECGPVFNRLAGADRVGTATAISRAVFGVADTVVIAPSGDYPAALVAGPLAASLRAPVLLSGEGSLSAAVAEEIIALGATSALLVAPDGMLGGTIEADLAAAGITSVERIGGADRYAVAANVAARLGGTRAWLVQGEDPDPSRGWPDAVSAGPVAAQEGAPILLTRTSDLPAATGSALQLMGITSVSIAGGEAAVSGAVADALRGQGITVERLAGATRYETSATLAGRALELGAVPFNLWLVTGRAFPDSLAAGPAVAATGGVMLMVDGSDLAGSPASADFLAGLVGTSPFVTFVGGPAAIGFDVEQQVFDLLVGGPPPEG